MSIIKITCVSFILLLGMAATAVGDDLSYLIITHTDFENAIQPLAEWHHKKGLKTAVLTCTSATTPEEMKSWIEAHYFQNIDTLEFVLLVGDTDYVATFIEGKFPIDTKFADIQNIGDWYPELAIGRLPVKSEQEALDLVAKIMAFERNPPIDLWIKKALFVTDQDPGFRLSTKQLLLFVEEFQHFDQIYEAWDGPDFSLTLISNPINRGVQIVNYYGHGFPKFWDTNTTPPWNTDAVSGLSNNRKTPIVFNFACYTHKFNNLNDCLGEAWVKSRSNRAVASLGAVRDSSTYADPVFNWNLFLQLCTGTEYRLGKMIQNAKTYILDLPDNILAHDEAECDAKYFVLLGDPATEVWTDIPKSMSAAHPDQITEGVQNIQIVVSGSTPGSTLESAKVCLYKSGDVYQVEYTDSNGVATFDIDTFASTDPLHVTVTKHDFIPYEGEIVVVE